MFSSSLVAQNSGDLQDGLYTASAKYGLQRMTEISQIARAEDIWSGFMIYLLLLTAGVFLLCEVVAGITWLWSKYHDDSGDSRAQNLSFLLGLVLRIYLNLFACPILTFSFFQFIVTKDGPAYLTALAALVLAAWIISAIWVSRILLRTKPRQLLHDDLPTMLRYGTLYNTYNEQGTIFFLVEFITTFMRAITIGAIQASGLAQIILLAVIELFYFFCILIIKPFDRETSMNIITCLTSVLRFILIFLSLPFLGSLNIYIVTKQWLGYVILIIHALVSLLFLMHGIQVVVEVILRYYGVATDEMTGAIYSLKQLSKRRRTTEDDIPMLDSKRAQSQRLVSHKPGSSMEGRGLLISDDPSSGTLRTPTADGTPSTFNRDSAFEEIYIASPSSENGVFTNNRDSIGYYRKPRQRGSHDRPNFNPLLGREPEEDVANTDGTLLDAIRSGIISPPPPGVDYAVRESDIYYTKRATHRKKRRHRRKEDTGAEVAEAKETDLADNTSPYDQETYASDDSDSNRQTRYSDYGGMTSALADGGGVLAIGKHRSRNPNSMVGLLDGDSSLPYSPDYDAEAGAAPAARPNVLLNWFRNKKQQLFGKGYEEPSIEPRGFEVIRRGPIRPRRQSSEFSSSDSESESARDSTNQTVPDENAQEARHVPEQSPKRMSVINALETASLIAESVPDSAEDTSAPAIPPRSPRPRILRPTIIHHQREPSDSYIETSAGTFIFPTSPKTSQGTSSNPVPSSSSPPGVASSSTEETKYANRE